MAFSLNFSVSLSSDKKSITIIDDGTVWDDGILSPSDFTELKLVVLGENKETIVTTVILAPEEIATFSTGITLLFSDSRFFNREYPLDNYYVVYLRANDTYNSNWQAFEIHLGLSTRVHINNATVVLRPQSLFQIENNLQAVVALDTMERLVGNDYAADREYRWRALYYHILDNIINKY